MSETNKSLDELIERHPLLKKKLIEALATDHFFITVSCQLKRPGDPNDLQHFYCQNQYTDQDCINSLTHIHRDFIAEKCPTAIADEPGGSMI